MTLTFTTFWSPYNFAFMKKVQIANFYLMNLKSCFSRIFPGPYRPRVASNQKLVKKCTHLGPSLTLPIRNKSKFQLFSELQIILIFPEFPGARSKICKIQKCTHLGPSLTMLFGKKSKFQFYIVFLKSPCYSRFFLGPYGPCGASNKKVVRCQSVLIWVPL